MKTDARFERWTVVSIRPTKSLCRCDCGTERLVVNYDLQRGVSKSCGCLSREITAKRSRIINRTHGMDGTPIYRIWIDMRRRCSQPQRPDYKNYGARGITVCERWQTFENFHADMGDRPSAKHSLERRDNEGSYTADNCYWATAIEQGANRRTNRKIMIAGTEFTVTNAARKFGINIATLFNRLNRGVSPEQAILP